MTKLQVGPQMSDGSWNCRANKGTTHRTKRAKWWIPQ